MKKRLLFITVIALSISVIMGGEAFAADKDKATCMNKANSMFKVNNASTKVYNNISDISPGNSLDAAGVEWACSGGTSRGITWLTDDNGYTNNGNGTYTIHANAFINRTGTTNMAIVGAVSYNWGQTIYATNVLICNSSKTKCDGAIGISYPSGWSNAYGNFTGSGQPSAAGYGNNYRTRDLLRATSDNTSGLNGWTKPQSIGRITIDGETLINNAGIDESPNDYGVITLKLFRGFNNGSSSYGWSTFQVLVEKKPDVSAINNKTRARTDVGNDGTVDHTDTTGFGTDSGTISYTTAKKSNSIQFDSILHAKVLSGNEHNATFTWSGLGSTSGTSASTTIAAKHGNGQYTPSDWSGSTYNYKKVSVNLDPGENDTKCSGINTPQSYSTTAGGSGTRTSQICIKLSRASARFSGTTTAAVIKNTGTDGGTSVNIPNNHVINLANSDDGSYKITFTHKVSRGNDGAGENVATYFEASRRDPSAKKSSTATWSPTDSNKKANTTALAEGGQTNVWTPSVSGTLKYGESRTFCSTMSYRAVQKTSDALTKATDSEYCITITRPKASCSINAAFKYGVSDGINVGTIGVRNFNSGATDFSWTTVNRDPLHTLAYNDRNIWAMPGDDIQFKYGACAGAFYAIEYTPTIVDNGTHYSTAGWLAVNAKGSDGSTGTRYFYGNNTTSDGYLFKDTANKYRNYTNYKNPVNFSGASLNAIRVDTPLPYATWTTGNFGTNLPTSGFLSHPANSEPVAEMFGNTNGNGKVKYTASPSTSGYDGTTANTYKVCKSADGEGCVLGRQDVGGVIVQQLTWNYHVVENSNVIGSAANHSATGMVRVPYNYYLQPFVRNESGVVYLGESGVMNPGVVVFPRENKYVHGGATYATTTKETHINVKVYNQQSGKVLAVSNSNTRLNKEGKTLNSGSETRLVDNSFLPNGMKFTILDDNTNQVGQKICTEIKIWPVDSHETGNRNAVRGAAENNSTDSNVQYALMEGYRTTNGQPRYSATATSCSTIAKRPTMSVESSNAYSATSFTTSLYAKTFYDKKYIFGSWSEYGVFGSINTSDGKTFVSGAAIGYAANQNNTVRNTTRDNEESLSVATGTTSGKVCQFTTQTFVNIVNGECSSKDTTIGRDAMKNYRDDILRRYDEISNTRNKVGSNLDAIAADLESYRLDDGDTNSVIGVYTEGDASLSTVPATAENTNHTIVYNVNGTLTINGNINDERNVPKKDPSEMTGVIIIADRVWIDASVDYINAVIVTREKNNAEVNTCKTSNGVTMTINGVSGTLNSKVCNKTLVFDAPVFTRKIILNRTAGASDGKQGAGRESIKRAEIFNLNMANYLWSYSQMTTHGQAETTYIKELPPRY
ncbi:MAG: hypothetical protein MJ154_02410 [Candidatus Saccharibacteria bacterium]|nr:hypothetical protein [Candidatus Saccharibacteria bacterium]